MKLMKMTFATDAALIAAGLCPDCGSENIMTGLEPSENCTEEKARANARMQTVCGDCCMVFTEKDGDRDASRTFGLNGVQDPWNTKKQFGLPSPSTTEAVLSTRG